MTLNLSKLGADATKLSGEDPVDVLRWDGGEADILRPAGVLRWDINARLWETELFVKGSAGAEFEGVCARCGKPITLTVREPLLFSMDVGTEQVEVDLTPEIREAVLLALPLNPLCREDCPGLCPRCGKPLGGDGAPCACGGAEADCASNPFNNLNF